MEILDNVAALRRYVRDRRAAGQRIAFVPTMGALHAGHLALVQEGRHRADCCIPYIFLNPRQFAPHEDLAAYPKTLDVDLEKLAGIGTRAVYVPRADEIYPDGFDTIVNVGGISQMLEGEYRPHFFSGVATVLTKMFLHALPDIALFGEKDYQQLLVIKKLVHDLDFPIEIMGIETVRDENGLALSSRNAYLSADDYKIAIRMNKILADMAGKNDEWGTKSLLEAGFEKVDYCTVRDSDTLLPPMDKIKNRRALAAAWIGKTRLIDNLPL